MRVPAHILTLLLLMLPGCAYHIGSGLTAGALDEAGGKGRSAGIERVAQSLLEKQLLAEIGQQLGEGLKSGATELTPEQRAHLEASIDGLITVAALRAGAGIDREVSPAMRRMVRDDIVGALNAGMRGELGATLEETTDRVVTRAVLSLRKGIADPDTSVALSETLRDAVHLAMREGGVRSPSVGETLQTTLTENLLDPFETSVTGIADSVAEQVDAQARRTENTLKAIIAFLLVAAGIILFMYVVAQRNLVRQRQATAEAHLTTRTLGAALGLLDDDTRKRIQGLIDEAQSHAPVKKEKKAVGRSDDYVRKG